DAGPASSRRRARRLFVLPSAGPRSPANWAACRRHLDQNVMQLLSPHSSSGKLGNVSSERRSQNAFQIVNGAGARIDTKNAFDAMRLFGERPELRLLDAEVAQ